jgi:twitching motility protein PilT
MILISGPPGNGKTTTIVSLLARICARSALHVMTLESPIEHVLRWQRSIVSQYEVGRDVSSFAEGVRAALHAPTETPQAVNRLVGLFPSNEQERARWRIAESLRALVGLRLLPARDGSGLRPAAEIMLGTEAVRRLIRDGSIHMIRTTIASSRREGMQLLETALSDLVAEGAVDLATARSASHYPDEVREAPVALRRR